MKKLLATAVAALSLLVAAPVASAAGSPPSNIAAPSTHVSCMFSYGSTTYSWNFMLPSFAVPYFQQALAQIQQYYPGALSCTFG